MALIATDKNVLFKLLYSEKSKVMANKLQLSIKTICVTNFFYRVNVTKTNMVKCLLLKSLNLLINDI